MRKFKLAAAFALGVSAAALSGCATGFPAQVSRFQAMPAPQGQSFVPVAAHLAAGVAPADLGHPVPAASLVRLPAYTARQIGGL